MKVLMGTFVTESNANVPAKTRINHYDTAFGEDCLRKMNVADIYAAAGIETIGAIYADAGGNGVVTKDAFDYIEGCFADAVRAHLQEIDGIYLFLHGASEVEEIGSGDHHILKTIREITGPYLPIAVVCDPHGNLCQEYVDNCTILRSYRESPHTDAQASKRIVSQMLCDLLHDRQHIHAVYRKLPLILGGEQSVSADEPVRSINRYMDELEHDPRIRSVSWHVGYIRHDCDVAGCGIVVVPQNTADQAYAETIADQLADYVWNKRHEFHYTGLTAHPDEALKMALDCAEKPVFITDSGDNVTSGATGWNTFVLRQVLAVKELNKRFLFATICDPAAYETLAKLPDGTETSLKLGVGYDEYSAPVTLEVVVKSKGELRGFMYRDHNRAYGYCVTVSVKGLPVEIMVASNRQAMVEIHQFTDAGIALIDGQPTAAGNLRMMQAMGLADKQIEQLHHNAATQGRTPLFIAQSGVILGMIAVADTIKPTSRAAVAEFKRMGIDVILLTGDNPQVAQAIAAQAGIDNVIAEVLPSDKQRVVSQVQAEGRKVAMIGDGINDAPALAQADVGIAIGAGTDVAIESADIVLMKSDLWDAVTAVKLSKAVLRNIKQNLFWALIYNSIGIPLAAGVFIPLLDWKLNPMFGAAAMSLSSVSVVSNALRLKLFSSPRPAGLPESSSAPAAQVAVQHIELKNKGEKNMTKTMIVNGMACAHCKARVEAALNAVAGVEKAEVTLDEKKAVVSCSQPVEDSALIQAVTDAGYEVVSVA